MWNPVVLKSHVEIINSNGYNDEDTILVYCPEKNPGQNGNAEKYKEHTVMIYSNLGDC